jgi:hypothetical protein
MFESFSKSFETTFRIFFICWVSFWAFVNILSLITSYTMFSSNPANLPGGLGAWWINTMSQIVTLSLGAFLLFLMINVAYRISKNKKILNIGLMTTVTVFYYLTITIIQIVSEALFRPETLLTTLVFMSTWIMPSIIILIVHILYFSNLRKYNSELETSSTPIPTVN